MKNIKLGFLLITGSMVLWDPETDYDAEMRRAQDLKEAKKAISNLKYLYNLQLRPEYKKIHAFMQEA